MNPKPAADIGVTGLAVMGRRLAGNLVGFNGRVVLGASGRIDHGQFLA